MNEKSYRKKILEAAHEIATKEGNVSEITFETIAKYCGIKVKQIKSEYSSMADVFFDTGCQHVHGHEAKSQKIVKLHGEYSLATLIKHDLSLMFYYARDSADPKAQDVAIRILEYVHDYITNTMPKYYYDILRHNPDLIPNKSINAQVYSHFIVHSMFFFTKKEMFLLNPDSHELQQITRNILTQLFHDHDSDLKIKQEMLQTN